MTSIYFMVNEIFAGNTKKFLKNDKGDLNLYEPKKKSTIENEEIDTTNIPELKKKKNLLQKDRAQKNMAQKY